MAIHNDPPEKCTMRGFHRFLINSPLQVSNQNKEGKSLKAE